MAITVAVLALLSLGGCQGLSLFGLFETEHPGPFSISPSAAVLQTDETVTLHALGGFGVYAFDFPGLQGSFDPATGLYTPPGPPVAEPLVETISASDELGNERTATLTVYNQVTVPLTVTPASWAAVTGESRVFVLSGGVAPYSAVLDGLALAVAVDQVTVNTTGLADGDHRLEIGDAMQSLAVAVITVIPIGTLGIDPISARVVSGGTVLFTALNAVAPVFSVDAPGTGSILPPADVSPATYQAPVIPVDSGATEVVRLTDGIRTVTAAVQVYNVSSALEISPTYSELLVGETLELKASGGVPPYSFTVAAGKGTVQQTGPTTALYSAPPALPSRDQVCLLDSVGSQPVYAVIRVSKPR